MANNVWEKLNNKRRLKKILNKRIATYEKAKHLVQMNRSINKAEADALITHYDSHISALNTMKRENDLGFVKAFPSEDGSDIVRNYNNFLTRNREMVMQNNIDGGRIERNAANPNDVQHIRTQDYYHQEVINRYAQSRPPLNPVEIERQRAMERNIQAAGNRSSIAIPSRGASRFHDESGRPLAAGNRSPDTNPPRVDSLRYDINGRPLRGNNIPRDALPPRSASLPLVRAFGASAANAGDRLLQNELVRNGNNRVDRVVQVSNGTNVDIEPMRGETVDSTKDKGKGRADSYIESSSGNSQNSGYFSSDISNNRGSNTSTYSQKSSERNSASGSSQLVKNDSYEHTNNRINQRRRNQ
jgi:hypothetical protein